MYQESNEITITSLLYSKMIKSSFFVFENESQFRILCKNIITND